MAQEAPAIRLLSVAQVAGMTALSAGTIRRAIGAGELVGYKLRGQYRVRDQDLEAWLGRCRYLPADDVVEPAVVIPLRASYRW